jgi:hypothetical protein
MPGPPQQSLPAMGYLIVGQEPADSAVKRAQETLEARTHKRVIIPVADGNVFFESGQRLAGGGILLYRSAAQVRDWILFSRHQFHQLHFWLVPLVHVAAPAGDSLVAAESPARQRPDEAAAR